MFILLFCLFLIENLKLFCVPYICPWTPLKQPTLLQDNFLTSGSAVNWTESVQGINTAARGRGGGGGGGRRAEMQDNYLDVAIMS